MKKIPTLFVRNYDNGGLVTDTVTPGTEWVINGEGLATRKWDGLAILIKNGEVFKRYDAKAFTIDKQTGEKRVYDRKPPEGFVPLQEPEKNLLCFLWLCCTISLCHTKIWKQKDNIATIITRRARKTTQNIVRKSIRVAIRIS